MKRPWSNLPIKERMDLLKSYSRSGLSYKEASEDFSNILKSYEEGGKLTYEIYEEQTGKPWNTAREEGLTDGSYEQNMQLRARLINNNPTNFQEDRYNTISFSEAFKKARATQGSEGIFEWNGKKYNTKYKEELDNNIIQPSSSVANTTNTVNTALPENDEDILQYSQPNIKETKDNNTKPSKEKNSSFTQISKKEIDEKIKDIFKTKPLNKIKTKPPKDEEIKTQIDKEQDEKTVIKNEVATIVKEQLKEEKNESWYTTSTEYLSNLYDGILNKVITEANTLSEDINNTVNEAVVKTKDILKYGKGWINKVLMEDTELVKAKDKIIEADNFDNNKEKKAVVSLNLETPVLQEYIKNKREIQKTTIPKKQTFDEEKGYKGKNVGFSLKANGDIHSFTNAFNNNEGYNYTPIPNVENHIDSTYNSPGVAHFLLDSDVSQNEVYQHEYAKNMINKQLKGENIQGGSTVDKQYFPIGIKLKDGKVNIKYKTKDEFVGEDEENIISPMRQYKYSDFDWGKSGVKTSSFNSSVVSVPVKNVWQTIDKNGQPVETKESHLIYAKDIGKKAYGDFSGTSVVFILNKNGERLIVDYGNSVDNIQNKAKYLIKKYEIPENELIIGVHDLGSFNSKPVGKKGKLKYNPKSFNPNSYTGGALAF